MIKIIFGIIIGVIIVLSIIYKKHVKVIFNKVVNFIKGKIKKK